MKKYFRQIRFLVEYVIVLIVYAFLKIVPHWLIIAFSRFAGICMYMIPGIRNVSKANIKACFPEKTGWEIAKTARTSLFNLMFNLFEFIWMTDNPKRIEKYTQIPEEINDKLKDYVAKGIRIIFVNPHLGSWEVSGLAAPYYAGVKMVAIAKPVRNPYLNRLLNKGGREKEQGLKIIFSKGAVRESVKALRQGMSVGTLIDQNTRVRDGGVFVNFFGLPVSSSKAPATLFGYCLKNNINAVIIYGSCLRLNNGIVTAHAEWLSKPFEDYASEEEIIQELMNISEKYIRLFPEQYLWFYKRFQNIPRGISAAIQKKYPYYARVADEKFYSKVKPHFRNSGKSDLTE